MAYFWHRSGYVEIVRDKRLERLFFQLPNDCIPGGPHPTPYTLHTAPCTLHPTHYTLHPTPYTLHPAPDTLHPTPDSLHPTDLFAERLFAGRLCWFNCRASLLPASQRLHPRRSAGCRVEGAGCRCRVQDAECRVQGVGCGVQGAECRVQGVGCRVCGTVCGV
jgi:hypothetical protein